MGGGPAGAPTGPKALDQAKGIKAGASFDGAVSGPGDPLAGRCSKYFSDMAVAGEQAKPNGATPSLKVGETPAPEAEKKEVTDSEKDNDGKAKDAPSAGDSKFGDHVRTGVLFGLVFGIFGALFATAILGPVGLAIGAGMLAGGFGLGYGVDKLTNKD